MIILINTQREEDAYALRLLHRTIKNTNESITIHGK